MTTQPMWQEGEINWYDASSNRGSILGSDGIWYRIHEDTEFLCLDKQRLQPRTKIWFQLATTSIHPIVTVIALELQESE